MASYIHGMPRWPEFHWDINHLSERLTTVRHRQGRLLGHMEALGFSQRSEALLLTLTDDVITSSAIEGEILDRGQVRSSVARRLGLETGALAPADRAVEGVVEMMLDATQNHAVPLTEERLHAWHAALFPTGRSGMRRIAVGAWRDDRARPMQVVSGPLGREHVHFQAPPAERLGADMTAFLDWFNGSPAGDPVIRAGVAHLWFVTIHPFDDGNGRIARAIADMVLARSEHSPQLFYSMSSQIRKDRRGYYDILETTQKGDLDITGWLDWFLICLGRAIEDGETTLAGIFRKARFWKKAQDTPLNVRQRAMLNRLLDGFDGKLTTSKWARIEKCSQDTALRDISDLLERGILVKQPDGGRSTHYGLVESGDTGSPEG